MEDTREVQLYDGIDPNRIRCVLTCEEKIYLLLGDVQDTNSLICVRRELYRGFVGTDEDIPERIFFFAEHLLDRHAADADRYPLRGEWYQIKGFPHGERTRWRIRRSEGRRRTTGIIFRSAMLHYLVALTLAAFVFAWHMDQSVVCLSFFMPYTNTLALTLILLVIQMAGVTSLFCWLERRRDLTELYFNAYIPLGLIVMAGLLKCHWWMWIVMPIGLIAAYIMANVLSDTGSDGIRRVGECLKLALILLLIAVMVFSSLTGVTPGMRANGSDITDAEREEAERLHRICCEDLKADVWETLSTAERLELLQRICDYECRMVLGCGNVTVLSGPIRDDNTWGEYRHYTGSVLINQEHLEHGDVADVVNTALHEVRHAYQHHVTEMYSSLENHIEDKYKNLYLFRQVRAFSEELTDYRPGKEDFDRYYGQQVEIDCREWAVERLNEFYMDYIYPQR